MKFFLLFLLALTPPPQEYVIPFDSESKDCEYHHDLEAYVCTYPVLYYYYADRGMYFFPEGTAGYGWWWDGVKWSRGRMHPPRSQRRWHHRDHHNGLHDWQHTRYHNWHGAQNKRKIR